MQEDTLVNNAKKALSEAQERLNARCEQIKSQILEVKAQVKSTAKSIVDEAKAKGRSALYRVSEFLGIKKRFLDIQENVRGAIKTTDKDIAKTALLAKGFREAGQTVANAFRAFDRNAGGDNVLGKLDFRRDLRFVLCSGPATASYKGGDGDSLEESE